MPTLGRRPTRRVPCMGSGLLPELMPSRELSLGPGLLGACLGPPCLSLFSFDPLLYFRLEIPSPSPRGVLVRFVLVEFSGSILGPFYLDPSPIPQVFVVVSSQVFVVLIHKNM